MRPAAATCRHLWQTYRRRRTPEALEALVTYYLPTARRLAPRIAKIVRFRGTRDDIENVALRCLHSCLTRFSRGVFTAFFSQRLQWAYGDAIREDGRETRSLRKRGRQVFDIDSFVLREAPGRRLDAAPRDSKQVWNDVKDRARREIDRALTAHGTPFDVATAREELQILRRRMSRREWRVFELRFFRDLTYAELGKELQVCEAAAFNRVRRALRRAREILTHQYGRTGGDERWREVSPGRRQKKRSSVSSARRRSRAKTSQRG